MTADERKAAFHWINKHCVYGIGIVHHRIIDKHNIYQATLIAMKKALINLLHISSQRPSVILTDAMPLDLFDTHFHEIPVYYFPKGESKSSSIAAASIVAKVTRDGMMDLYDLTIPGYTLITNKGYGTAVHKAAIKMHHHSIIHRKSFLTKLMRSESEVQLEIGNDATREIFCGSD
jgi:ribonuclease HII